MTNTTTWAIDPMHSEVQFKIRHLVISTVTGSFKNFSGSVVAEEDDFNNAKINFTVDVMSLQLKKITKINLDKNEKSI